MGNNPMAGVDPDGKAVYYYDAVNGGFTHGSNLFGDNVLIIHYYGQDGKFIHTLIDENVNLALNSMPYRHSFASDGLIVSNYDYLGAVLEGYNSKTGYEYTVDDLFMRRAIVEGKSHHIKMAVLRKEEEGLAMPLTESGMIEMYGETVYNLKLFTQYFSMMLSVSNFETPVPQSSSTNASAITVGLDALVKETGMEEQR
jgi:hypothetical protein